MNALRVFNKFETTTMLKKINYLAVLIKFLTLCLATPSLYAQTVYEIYTNVSSGFSVEYPADWQVIKSEHPDGGSHFLETAQNPPTVAVNVNKLKSSASVSDAAQSAEEFILSQQGMGKMKLISESEISASGLDGIEKFVEYRNE